MYKAYKFRLYPNNQQKEKLNKTFGCNRFVYNYYLRKIISEGYINAYSCIKDYTNKLKYEYPFLQEIDPTIIKKTLFNLQDNYKRHLNSGISNPKYRSKYGKNSYTIKAIYNNQCNIELDLISRTIKLPELEELKISEEDLIINNITEKSGLLKKSVEIEVLNINEIIKKMIVFGIGPAGTGKTYLAMAMAIQAFKNNEVNRIILTRPAIEAGEKLGFLPGDLQSKIDPYLRPLYDALYQIMGAESFIHNQEKGLIEVAPLAYMRGRTLDNAFIILDEAQNTTPAQMKMFLTRIGFGSKVIVTGDRTQKDLPKDVTSGLDVALKVLKDIDEIAVCRLSSKDVVRHPLVQKIVNAYDEYDKKAESKKQVRAQIKVKDRRNDH